MKGGFNKILRNIVAGSSDTEYEKVSDGGGPQARAKARCNQY